MLVRVEILIAKVEKSGKSCMWVFPQEGSGSELRILPGRTGDPRSSGENNRLFQDAVLRIVRTGAPQCDLPKQFGESNSIVQRFNRWAKKGGTKEV